jgi:hypothetical protein
MAKTKSFAEPTEVVGVFKLCKPNGDFLAYVDEADVASVTRFRWHRSGNYIARSFLLPNKKQTLELLQRHIAANAGHDIELANVKFHNQITTDCRRENLRVLKRKHSKLAPAAAPAEPGETEAPVSVEQDHVVSAD